MQLRSGNLQLSHESSLLHADIGTRRALLQPQTAFAGAVGFGLVAGVIVVHDLVQQWHMAMENHPDDLATTSVSYLAALDIARMFGASALLAMGAGCSLYAAPTAATTEILRSAVLPSVFASLAREYPQVTTAKITDCIP